MEASVVIFNYLKEIEAEHQQELLAEKTDGTESSGCEEEKNSQLEIDPGNVGKASDQACS